MKYGRLFGSIIWIASTLALGGIASAQEVEGAEPNRGGVMSYEAQDPQVALERLHPQEGFEVNLFATEQEFPIGNPVSLTFDAKGRLWVATMPSYPQRLPDEDPNDKLIILEDTDHDGVADKHTVFADGLHVPTGFELGDGGAYIAQQPNLIFAKDTDGDDVADEREVILHGFGTEDSHHSISAFTWGPGGGLYFQEGTFHHSQVETPYGPVRLVDAGVFRYKPDRFWLEVFVSYRFANPWGHIFDRWGQNFIADASGGANYFGSAITGNAIYPEKRSGMKVFTSIVRPTAGCEIVRSRHFPEEAQGNFLVNNTIGFQGIKQHRIIEEGSGFTSEEVEPLLWSEDINFRPVDIHFGPDGALYIVDWFNPLIGHMQYSLRDERRDHGHGRIWRITYKHKPLLEPVNLTAKSIPELLDLLKVYEDRTRYRVRRELRERGRDEVAAALKTWVANLDKADKNYQHHLLEALWIYQNISVFNVDLLDRMLASPEPKARAAATRVLRFWRDYVGDTTGRLTARVNDEHPRVRLEALLGLSYLTNTESAMTALQARAQDTDYYLDYVLGETMNTLKPWWQPKLAKGELATPSLDDTAYLISKVSTRDLRNFKPSEPVYEALLKRADVSRAEREAALEGLAKATTRSTLDVLLDTLRTVDASGDRSAPRTAAALGDLLLDESGRDLWQAQETLRAMAQESRLDTTREFALAAVIKGEGRVDSVWRAFTGNARNLITTLGALSKVPGAEVRRQAYDNVAALLTNPTATIGGDTTESVQNTIREAAMETLVTMGGAEKATYAKLAALVKDGVSVEAAIAAMERIPQEHWSTHEPDALAERIVDYIEKTPVDKLSAAPAMRAFSVGKRLANLMPSGEANALRTELDELGITVVKIRPVPHQMIYDRTEFTVKAGRPVEIVLENIDIMPHNVVVTQPGAMRKVGERAEATATEPGAPARHYVPDMPEVMFATKLVQPSKQDKITFIAPDTPNDYPYVCTYPGHWITMNGIMHVREDVSPDMLAKTKEAIEISAAVREFVKEWTVNDLMSGIHRVSKVAASPTGLEVYEEAGCTKCHKLGQLGTPTGPELTNISEKYTPAELLKHIIEPSHTVEEEYQSYQVNTYDFQTHVGFLVEQTDEAITLRANQEDPTDLTVIPREDIQSMEKSTLSVMPTGLLTTFTKEEIYELLAILMAGGTYTDDSLSQRTTRE